MILKFLSIPFYSYFIMMIYAASMGRERMLKYAIGDEKILLEEYLIICAIAFVLTTIKMLTSKYD